jgi:hypothetical protein
MMSQHIYIYNALAEYIARCRLPPCRLANVGILSPNVCLKIMEREHSSLLPHGCDVYIVPYPKQIVNTRRIGRVNPDLVHLGGLVFPSVFA